MMKLNLRDLHIDILKHNRTYDVFDYSHNGIQFSVMFDVDCIPFKLILVKKRSTQYLILDVMAGYQINTYLGEKLQLLKDMLELKNGKTKFSTNQFFEEFNKKIPHTIQNKKYPNQQLVVCIIVKKVKKFIFVNCVIGINILN